MNQNNGHQNFEIDRDYKVSRRVACEVIVYLYSELAKLLLGGLQAKHSVTPETIS